MNITHYFLLFWILTKCRSDQMFVNFPWRNNFLEGEEKSWFGYPMGIITHLMGKLPWILEKNSSMLNNIFITS